MLWAWHHPKPRPSGSASNLAQSRQSRTGTPRWRSTSPSVMRSSRICAGIFAGSLMGGPLVSDGLVQVVEHVWRDITVGIADKGLPEARRELLDQGQPGHPF